MVQADAQDIFRHVGACKVFLRWFERGGFATGREAWDACERGDWLLWFAREIGADEKKVALAEAASTFVARSILKENEEALSLIRRSLGTPFAHDPDMQESIMAWISRDKDVKRALSVSATVVKAFLEQEVRQVLAREFNYRPAET